ncbi:uncharacterized protein LOC127725641 isoform X21 [Mytilus californianus]|uniref:uncharacterized protein LOC127725641 isoform X21 n=1 Tax=Mytilus californianus TaxID=6549 RepID=UPI002247BAE3|nr:uncharacterized protein LOC127725641 isoform X21 [Mytilus californianus]
MAQRILIILVILSVSFLLAESHWWRHRKRPRHGHCPSRDDENHECCDWEIKTYQQTIKYCRKCKVTPTNSSDICYYRARRHRYKQGCVVSFKYNVTEATCTPKCCEGWTRDEYGQCSIETDANTQEIVCENGGSPADDYCYCPDGFSGKHCESAVCTPHCLNNGICSGRDGEAICICPDGKYTGKQCETPVCDPACQNGGSCIDGIYRPMCSCPPGYEGESCEKEVKDGDCPAPSGSGICAEMCKTDSECPNEQKCCRNGCYAHQCMAPAATTCTYQGEQYPVGHRLQNNSCTTCVCKDPNSKNQWECVSISCPRLQCYKTKMIPNLCCPVCDDKPPDECGPICKMYCKNGFQTDERGCPLCICKSRTTPRPTTVRPTLPPNTGPSFKHCPSNTLIINTHREKFINIRRSVNLTVVDNSGTRYTIRYSKEIIEAIPCSCGKNIHIITAQSDPPDQYGRFASCHITVHVVDNHPPMYSTCPSEISAFEDEIISWDKPEASDNVGIKSERFISDYENNSKFPEGSHLLMYVAVDHEGNVGACRFLVAVYKRGTSDPTMPNQLKREDEEDKKNLIILPVIGVLAVLILMIAIILTALCCRRLKKTQNARQTESERNAYDNAIYATATPPRTPPPSYSKTDGMKLPPKYIVGDEKPPLYEEMDVKVFMKKGVQNPVYDSSDELEVGNIKLRMREEADA